MLKRTRTRLLVGTVSLLAIGALLLGGMPGPQGTNAAYVDTAHVASEGGGVQVPFPPTIESSVVLQGAKYITFDAWGRLWVTVANSTVKVYKPDLKTLIHTFNTGSAGPMVWTYGAFISPGVTQPNTMLIPQCQDPAVAWNAKSSTVLHDANNPAFGGSITTSTYYGPCDPKVSLIDNVAYILTTDMKNLPTLKHFVAASADWWGPSNKGLISPREETRWNWTLKDMTGVGNIRNDAGMFLYSDDNNRETGDNEVYKAFPSSGIGGTQYELFLDLKGFHADMIFHEEASGTLFVGSSGKNFGSNKLQAYKLNNYPAIDPKTPIFEIKLTGPPLGKVVLGGTGGGIYYLPMATGDAATGEGIVKVLDEFGNELPDIRIPDMYNLYDVATGSTSSHAGSVHDSFYVTGSAKGSSGEEKLVKVKIG